MFRWAECECESEIELAKDTRERERENGAESSRVKLNSGKEVWARSELNSTRLVASSLGPKFSLAFHLFRDPDPYPLAVELAGKFAKLLDFVSALR